MFNNYELRSFLDNNSHYIEPRESAGDEGKLFIDVATIRQKFSPENFPTSQSRFAINKVRKPKTFPSLSSRFVSCTSLQTPSDKAKDTIKVFLSCGEKGLRGLCGFECLLSSENLWICENSTASTAFVAWRVWRFFNYFAREMGRACTLFVPTHGRR